MRLRHGVGAAQRGEVGDGLLDRRCVQVALASDAGIAAFLAFRGLFKNDNPGSQVVGGDRRGYAGRPKSNDNNIRIDIPLIWH